MSYLDVLIDKLMTIYGGNKNEWLELVELNGFYECFECFDLIINEQSQGWQNEIRSN